MISPGSGNITAIVTNSVESGPGLDSLTVFPPTLSLVEDYDSRYTHDFVQENDLLYVKLKRFRAPALWSLTFPPPPSVCLKDGRGTGSGSKGLSSSSS